MSLEKIRRCVENCFKKDIEIDVPVVDDNVLEIMSKFDWDSFENVIESCSSKPCGDVFEKSEKVAISYLLEAYYSNDWHKKYPNDFRLLAYALATVRLECGRNMLPVRECFAKDDKSARACVKRQGRKYAEIIKGHCYYGRGFVQLTWYDNYKKEGIENNPDIALEPSFASKLLFEGLVDGRWNGKKKGLFYYLDELKNPVEARRTVNGLNKAERVASWYEDFLKALLLGLGLK